MQTPAQQKRQQDRIDKAKKYWENVIISGVLKCRTCEQVLPLLDNFKPCTTRAKKTGYLAYDTECKSCRSQRNYNDRHFIKTSLEDILGEYLYKSSIRANKKKWEINIDLPFLLELWDKQKGLCFYTKKQLSLIVDDQNKVSIDRLDSNKGYTQDNVVLCRKVINYMKNGLSLYDFNNLIIELYDNFVS